MYKITKRQRLIAMGGTFDHFHKGHQEFILYAASQAQELLIGVTSKKFTHHKSFPHTIQSFKIRIKAVLNFCKENNIKHQIIPLDDPYGPTIDKENRRIDSLCVTQETLSGGEKINEIRLASTMREIDVFVAPLIKDELGKVIHAENIRAGDVNKQGVVYLNHFQKDFKINEKQRAFFGKPLGPIVTQPKGSKKSIVCVVGDFALNHFLEKGWPVNVSVFDGKSSRKPYSSKLIDDLKIDVRVNNPAGSITQDLLSKIKNIKTKKKFNIFVEGEEDLVSVALILTLPLYSLIYYGQPNEGMVLLTVTEDLKEKVFKILTK
jgi:pantetheine-phosphate adenylyltransferase